MANRRNNRFAFSQYLSTTPVATGTTKANGSVPFSWASHPSAGLAEPSPLLVSVAGRKYHYPPAFHGLPGSCPGIEADIVRSPVRGHGVSLRWLPRF